jgi:hypothetical protein
VRLRGVLATFEAFDTALDGLNGPSNPFLDEIRCEIGFVAELVVQSAFGFGFGSDVVAVVTVPTPLACGVGAMLELLDSLSKGSVCSFGSVEFDDGGSTVFHCVFTHTVDVTYMSGVGQPL